MGKQFTILQFCFSVSERAFNRLDWLLDIVNRYADSLSTTVDLDQVHFLANVCVPIAGLLRRKSPSQSLMVIVADLSCSYRIYEAVLRSKITRCLFSMSSCLLVVSFCRFVMSSSVPVLSSCLLVASSCRFVMSSCRPVDLFFRRADLSCRLVYLFCRLACLWLCLF